MKESFCAGKAGENNVRESGEQVWINKLNIYKRANEGANENVKGNEMKCAYV